MLQRGRAPGKRPGHEPLPHSIERVSVRTPRKRQWLERKSTHCVDNYFSRCVFLDLAIERPLADAEQLAASSRLPLVSFRSRRCRSVRSPRASADQVERPAARLAADGAMAWMSSGRSSMSRTPSTSMTTMLSIAFRSSRTLPGHGRPSGLAAPGERRDGLAWVRELLEEEVDQERMSSRRDRRGELDAHDLDRWKRSGGTCWWRCLVQLRLVAEISGRSP